MQHRDPQRQPHPYESDKQQLNSELLFYVINKYQHVIIPNREIKYLSPYGNSRLVSCFINH